MPIHEMTDRQVWAMENDLLTKMQRAYEEHDMAMVGRYQAILTPVRQEIFARQTAR